MPSLTGGCLCGGVRFEVTEPFQRVTYCHCTNCKKISGGAATVNGRSSTKAIRVLEGHDLLHTYQPEEGSAKTFCSECGSNLFGGGWPESEQSSVRISALDAFDEKPSVHNYVRSIAPWEVLPDDGADRHEVRGP